MLQASVESSLRSELSLLARYARPHRTALSLGSLGIVAEASFALALPYLGGLVAAAIFQSSQRSIRELLVIAFLVMTAQAALRFMSGYMLGRCSNRLLADMRQSLYAHLQQLPLRYLQSRRKGDLLSVLASDVHQIGGYLTASLTQLLGLALTALGSLYLMWRIDPRLTFLSLVSIPAFYLIIKIIGRKVRFNGGKLNEAHWKIFSLAEENMALAHILKSFTRERFERERYAALNETVRTLEDRQLLHAGGLSPAMQWIAGVAVIALLWFAEDRIGVNRVDPAGMVSFLLYAALLTRPVSAFADLYGQTQITRAALERVHAVLAEPVEPIEAIAMHQSEPAAPARTRAPALEFRDLSFAYPERSAVFERFDLKIASGEAIMLAGKNGVGKSTLVHLLLRFIDPDGGEITIDGKRLDDFDLGALRRMVGYVPQHVQLLNASIRDNIAYGKPNASLAEIEAVARFAQAHEFVSTLPSGYDTLIGEQGIQLSGGQRQRVALARALLVDPAILILDEATSMFDRDGEARFFAMFNDIRKTRTVIMIAHSDEAGDFADRVVEIGLNA
jgi:ATP-binding cassette, subfamily B, bacterial